MRIRFVVLFAVILLPASSNAQRIPLRWPWIGKRPPTAEPLPPQAPAIARQMRYQRSRFSSESYAFETIVATDRNGNSGGLINSSLGFGDRLDWRAKPQFSVTADLGQSRYGAPFRQLNLDLGGRYRPLSEHRLRPYVDARVSHLWSSPQFAQLTDPTAVAAPNILGRMSSTGNGALAGVGFETSLTNSFSLNSGLSLGRYQMTSRQGYTQNGYEPARHFGITTARFTLGLTYNPGHMVPMP